MNFLAFFIFISVPNEKKKKHEKKKIYFLFIQMEVIFIEREKT